MFGRLLMRAVVSAGVLISAAGLAWGDVFHLPPGVTSLEFVTVGNPGNAPDDTGYGAVAYAYEIGKYEVTNAQWREFLNHKAAVGDPYGLYNRADVDGYNEWYGIDRRGSGTPADPWVYYSRANDPAWDNRPVTAVSFWNAARFCNWLHNGQGDGDTEGGAYINIGNSSTFARQPGAKYFIPTEDEWYKAAYYDPAKAGGPGYWEYPTRSNTMPTAEAPPGTDLVNGSVNGWPPPDWAHRVIPVGSYTAKPSTSAYGTFDQAGNVWEWNETAVGALRGLRGDSWNGAGDAYYMRASYRFSVDPATLSDHSGFRVASVPEPGSMTLLAVSVIGLLAYVRRRRRHGA